MIKDYLGENIKSYREAKGLTQKELGKILCVSPQAVSKWEKKTAYPDVLLLPVLARLLGKTVDSILTERIVF